MARCVKDESTVWTAGDTPSVCEDSSARIFGPVLSRRLGRSLGVDVVPPKTCTYDCIYCESGPTTRLTAERFSPYSIAAILEELEYHLAMISPPPEVITLSGSGEPTLNRDIGKLIQRIQQLAALPVAVITNGSLLNFENVRNTLIHADLVLPSLDAATAEVFSRINRPHPSLRLDQIVAGLEEFRREFAGQMWLEILLVAGINDSTQEVEALQEVIARLGPERVQVNTVDRPPSIPSAGPVSEARLTEIAEYFGKAAEVISCFDSATVSNRSSEHLAKTIAEMVRRRPCTERQVSEALGVELAAISRLLESMIGHGQVGRKYHQGKYFYFIGPGDEMME
ncbi:MAG: radical SAM protein [Deltaproteobacteria bacterium]|nr:MAG: radical SAM protein [Deltaproteobacteria bacterium]